MFAGEMRIRIVNYDDMIHDCEAILETCFLLNLSPCLAWVWVSEYLTKYIKIEV